MADTQLQAYESIQSRIVPLQTQIFNAIRKKGGLTCEEIEIMFNLRHQTASARIKELQNFQDIEDSGQRRINKSGRNAIVWKCT